ncbi:MAG TPA: nucleoside monophosphate kinase [Alphaproteobacteria bacterium]|nr:nucleoside monophosphate kinase [Alphaproteobacteria bacterium]
MESESANSTANFTSFKILDEKEILVRLNGKANLKVGLCVGAYDLLHPGHIKHLESAKKLCDVLIVGVTQDKFIKLRKGEGRPVISENLRCYAIAMLSCVDYVILSDYEKATELIQKIKPDYYIKGPDYIGKMTPGILKEKEAVESIGGTLIFTTDHKMSTTEILNNSNGIKSSKPILLISGGIAGTGKSTVLRKLAKKYKFFYIDKDDINQSFMTKIENGKIISKDYSLDEFYQKNIRDQSYLAMFRIAQTALENGQDVILDGYFSDKIQTEYISNFLDEIKKNANVIKANFECSKEELQKRMMKRNKQYDLQKLEDFDKYYEEASKKSDWNYDINANTEGDIEVTADSLYHNIIKFSGKKEN